MFGTLEYDSVARKTKTPSTALMSPVHATRADSSVFTGRCTTSDVSIFFFSKELDSVGRLMVNLTNPNSYPPGGRTWAVAFIGTAGDLPLLVADGEGLLPEPSPVSRTLQGSGGYNNLPDEETIAYWPTDSAAISVWEAHRFVLLKLDD